MAKNWIAGAVKHKGALTKQATSAGMTPLHFARVNQHAPGVTGKRARLALTLQSFHRKGG